MASNQTECPHCGRGGFKGQRGLSIHIGKMHRGIGEQHCASAAVTYNTPPPSVTRYSSVEDCVVDCPYCGRGGFNGERGLSIHIGKMHKGPTEQPRRAPAVVAAYNTPPPPMAMYSLEDRGVDCPYCGRCGFNGQHGLSIHIGKMHKGVKDQPRRSPTAVTYDTPPASVSVARYSVEDRGVDCPYCDRGGFKGQRGLSIHIGKMHKEKRGQSSGVVSLTYDTPPPSEAGSCMEPYSGPASVTVHCPHCDRGGFKGQHGLSIHIGKMHKDKTELKSSAVGLPPSPPPSEAGASVGACGGGDTYRRGIGLERGLPALESITFPEASDHVVFFDLETTGLGRTADIVQIGAVSGSKQMSKYIIPVKPITAGAAKVTGLAVRNNRLFHNGIPVETCSLEEALVAFLDFIKARPTRPVLAGHNIASFDCPVLVHSLQQCGMVGAMAESVAGCIDTLKLAQKKLPKPALVTSHQQQVLVRELLGKEYQAHDALGDVVALQELYNTHLKLTRKEMCHEVFDPLAILHRISLKPLLEAKAISVALQTQLANAGLGLGELTLAHKRDPEDGVKAVLSGFVSGKPRVTTDCKVIKKLCTYLDNVN